MVFARRLLVLVLAMLSAAVVFAQNPEESGPSEAHLLAGKDYAAAFVIEPTTGKVLFQDNADTALPTASMAKMMTLLVVMDRIRSGEVKLDSPVTISARVSHIGGSRIWAKEGEVFPVQTLIAATMIHSANDAAEALAEKVGGSVDGFVDMMNDKARRLGLKDCRFYDPHGLPPSPGQQQDVCSARDLAVIGMHVLRYPLLAQYAKTPTMPFQNGTFTSGLVNPNHLIDPHKRDYNSEAIGIKTGYSGPAGYCVTAAAKRDGMELICVVMGAKTPTGPHSSFGIANRLMNEAFAKYRLLTGFHKGDVVGSVPVTNGRAKTVPAVASADVTALITRGDEENYTMALTGGATAPVQKGQQVGWIQVKDKGQPVSRVAALAGTDVPQQAWWRAFWPF